MTATQPQNRRLGYARVSHLQPDPRRPACAAPRCRMHQPEHLSRERSQARAVRRELLRMFDRLGPGDVVTVTRIDRLASSTFDLFGIVKRIVDAKAQFRSLAEPWATAAPA